MQKAKRIRILRTLSGISHRYRLPRALVVTISLCVLFAIPMTGFARVDLWGGNHFFLQKPVSLGSGIGGLLIAVLLLYAFTFLTNIVVGRFFCGWGCPVAYLNRLGENIEIARDRHERLKQNVAGAGFAAVFAGSLVVWFVDPYLVFTQPWPQVALAAIVFFVLVLATYLHSRNWRWSFCRYACPIGLYYSFVAFNKIFGIQFEEREACVSCNACDGVCPVHLAPRDLEGPISITGGIAVDGAPGFNHCLKCGDCVEACEAMIAKSGGDTVPLRLGWPKQPESTYELNVVREDHEYLEAEALR